MRIFKSKQNKFWRWQLALSTQEMMDRTGPVLYTTGQDNMLSKLLKKPL